MTQAVLYGIKNCDSVKKAQKWLKEQEIAYKFHDFRQDGLPESQLKAWLQQVDPKVLINIRSTTWKTLSEQERDIAISGQPNDVVLNNPTLIKRPVLAVGKHLEVGFKPDRYQALFNA